MAGMFGSPMALNVDPSLMQTGQPKKSGMFANADWASALSAGLAALSAGMGSPAGAAALQMFNQRRMSKDREAEYQQHRGDELSDYAKKLELAQQYKTPAVNDTVADYQFIMQQLGPEAGKRFLETKTNPIVMTPYGPMPYSAVNGGSQQVAAPVGKLTPIDDGGPRPLGAGGFPSVGY